MVMRVLSSQKPKARSRPEAMGGEGAGIWVGAGSRV